MAAGDLLLHHNTRSANPNHQACLLPAWRPLPDRGRVLTESRPTRADGPDVTGDREVWARQADTIMTATKELLKSHPQNQNQTPGPKPPSRLVPRTWTPGPAVHVPRPHLQPGNGQLGAWWALQRPPFMGSGWCLEKGQERRQNGHPHWTRGGHCGMSINSLPAKSWPCTNIYTQIMRSTPQSWPAMLGARAG